MIWFTAKCLTSNRKSTIISENLWEIEQLSKKEWRRKPFGPSTLEEFTDRHSKETGLKKTEYGIVEGDFMYRCILLRAAASREDLMADSEASRLVKPRRLSTGDTKIMMTFFFNHEEKEANKQLNAKSKKGAIKKSATSIGAKQVKRFHMKVQKESAESIINDAKVKDDMANKSILLGPSDQVADKDEENEQMEVSEALSDNIVASPLKAGDQQQIEEKGGDEDIFDKPAGTNNDSDMVTELKRKLKQMEQELLLARSNQPTALLEKIVTQNKEISEQISNVKLQKCPLNRLKYAVPPSEEDKDLEIPPDQTYVGGAVKLVPHSKLGTIDESDESFNQKGEQLFLELTGGEGIEFYAKTMRGVKANPKLQLKVIPASVISAFKKIVNECFQWVEQPTTANIDEFFRKQPGEARRRLQLVEKKRTNHKKRKNSDEESDS